MSLVHIFFKKGEGFVRKDVSLSEIFFTITEISAKGLQKNSPIIYPKKTKDYVLYKQVRGRKIAHY